LDNPDQLLVELQGALSALADIEFRYDMSRERLGAGDGSEGYQKNLVDLKACRERERAPLLDNVQELQRKMLDQLGEGGRCPNQPESSGSARRSA